MKFEAWERWISITGGTDTAFPCVQWHFNHCQCPIAGAADGLVDIILPVITSLSI